MATYKTPGVYVEEISKFPPSVAQVETAIPAFIGYTEKAEKEVANDLNLIPKRIKSLLEYETYFGGPDKETAINVTVNGDKIVVENDTPSDYLMYYSMQMYFANGGGPCYIMSIGTYGDTILVADYESGLAAIRKEDEPTLLLFPDAKALVDFSVVPPFNYSDFFAVYNQALTQCKELQDRFTIIDTPRSTELEEDMIALRDNIRSEKDYVKYGAAYYPFLETILDYAYDETDVSVENASSVSSKDSATAQEDSIVIGDLNTILTAIIATRGSIDGGPNTVTEGNLTAVRSQGQSIIDFLSSTATSLNNIAEIGITDGDGPSVTASQSLRAWVSDTLEPMVTALEAIQVTLNSTTSRTTVINNLQVNASNIFNILGGDALAAVAADFDFAATDLPGVLTGDVADAIAGLGTASITTLDILETSDNALYNKIKAAISNVPVVLPPSSAMAGIYARTDANVGVWKAPANTNVAYVQRPQVHISSEEQADMNVTTTGKSVNAIRTFTGKGTLVWGARTLAGNDNEWRYIPVRRFFNMVEESVSKASEQFVFESNDANTWVKMRAMIENFLNLQWKAGALAGSKPEQAYYVRVGLGQTMTAQDILEGRMIIEIGMAAVRPAEFIILRFSHKMQEA